MSYRALLFCPDETAARLVTQVLSELEFTVELSFEPFVTVQKLSAEPFDALVVDCANEDNASLLFKGARNSSLNHSSLCVAVVEGQMGVAKAFRIGANLVLTKPINIEQSKGTLRVARGLLRKTEPKVRATAESAVSVPQSPMPVSNSVNPPQFASVASMAATVIPAEPAAAAKSATVPSSLFEAEQKKPSVHDVDDTKSRDSVPSFLIQKPVAVETSSKPASHNPLPNPTASVTSSAAAAPALAPERLKASPTTSLHPAEPEITVVKQIKTSAPLASQEAITAERHFPEPAAAHVAIDVPAHVPMFSSYPPRSSSASGAGTKILWVFAGLLVLGPAAYLGWRKLQPMQYIHRPVRVADTDATSAPAQPAAEANSQPVSAPPVEQQSVTPSVPSPDASGSSTAPDLNTAAPEGFPTKETLIVGEPEPDRSVVAEPLHVRQKPTRLVQAPPTPPSLVLPDSKPTNTAIANIVSTDAPLPKPSSGAIQVSEGVTQGLLIKKVAPVYPPNALQLRKQGAVELLATVSKTGAITRVKVLSGDSLLTKAAVEAVRQWKYRPFLLNDEPVQIETQITIKFKLPN